MNKKIILIEVLLFLSFVASAQNVNSRSVQIRLQTLDHAQAPEIIDDHVLLSYQGELSVRMVGAAFANESYSKIHASSRNQFNVFVLLVPIPKDETELVYRFIVDGLWIADPKNQNTVKDRAGIQLSVFSLPRKTELINVSPLVLPDGIQFIYTGEEEKSVYLAGDFNNWNPFLYPLEEIEPGFYALSIDLPPGRYYYCYFENGKKKLDGLNPNFARNQENQLVNFFSFE